jgi:DNA-binding NarL/FixJ family response regulator
MSSNEILTLRVLIVDDMLQVRRDLSKVLPLAGEAAGLQITIAGEAADGQEAICQAQTVLPDVVLMDLVMPRLDGFAATQAIKTALPAIKVVALTVLDFAAAGFKARQAGADEFIEKGAPVTEIIQAIRRSLISPF